MMGNRRNLQGVSDDPKEYGVQIFRLRTGQEAVPHFSNARALTATASPGIA